MKRYMRPFPVALVLVLLLAGSFASCEYKDLCYQHPHWVDIRVQFDWKNAPDANPEGMTVLFYNVDDPTVAPVRFDLPGREGGNVSLLPGRYRALAYNYDTESILYRNTEVVSTFEAFTRPSSINEGTHMTYGDLPRDEGKDEESVILDPDMLWGATSTVFEIEMQDPVTYDYVKEGETATTHNSYTVTLVPGPRVCNVTVTVHDVVNMKYSTNYAGVLSTLSPSVMMESAVSTAGSVTQAYTFTKIDAETLQAKFHIFGHCEHSGSVDPGTHILTVYSLLDDESKWYYTFDVTNQMHDAEKNPDKYNVNIDVYGLPVPKPITNGSGLKPTVDNWDNIEIELPEHQ